MDNKILVIIPAYNEQDNIEQVIENLNAQSLPVDILVVNDCSTDNILCILRKISCQYIDLPVNLGIVGAVQMGYQYAAANHYDIAIQIDGDGQHYPQYLQNIVQPIIRGEADIVIRSRFIDKKGFQSTILRRAGIKMLSEVFFCLHIQGYWM